MKAHLNNGGSMKTEKEIRDEIEACKRTIKNHQDAIKNGELLAKYAHPVIDSCLAEIGALRWVLGENDRYD